MYLGCARSRMSKMRTPRIRSLLTESAGAKPCPPQSSLAFGASADMKSSSCLYTEMSFCDAGHTYAVTSVGEAGLETPQIWKPGKFPWTAYLPVNAMSELL